MTVSKRPFQLLGSLLLLMVTAVIGVSAGAPFAGALPTAGGQLQDDTPVAVHVTSAGVAYTFTAVTNQHLTLAVTNPVTSPAGSVLQMSVTDASNNTYESTQFSTSPADLNFTPSSAEAGLTTVVIQPDGCCGYTAANSANLTLTYATDVVGTLMPGKTVKISLTYEGQDAAYTFKGVINHHVTVAVTNPVTSPVGSVLQIAANNTSNATYESTQFSTSPADINFAPSVAGSVTVVISADGCCGYTPASSANLSLTYAKDVTGSLKSGVADDVHLKYAGQNADYRFTATTNHPVTLAVTNPVTSPAGSVLQMSVTDASNNTYESTQFSTSPAELSFTPTAAEAGRTTVVIQSDGCCGYTPASAARFALTYTSG